MLMIMLLDEWLEEAIQVEVCQVFATVNAIAARFNALNFSFSVCPGKHFQLFEHFDEFARWSIVEFAVESTVRLRHFNSCTRFNLASHRDKSRFVTVG